MTVNDLGFNKALQQSVNREPFSGLRSSASLNVADTSQVSLKPSRDFEKDVSMTLNEGVGSFKHISFQYAEGVRLDSEWFHSAGEKHFLNLNANQFFSKPFAHMKH